jgi:RHS repeat-associated protein
VVVVVADPFSLTKSAFGELLAHTGSDPQPYAFAGEPYDPNVGFQYHRARWMDPRVGRFVATDLFRSSPFEVASLHRFTYANADPLNAVDPRGESSHSVASALAAVSAALTVATRALPAFARGGAFWQRLAGLGRIAERAGQEVLHLYGTYNTRFSFGPGGDLPNGRNIDNFLALGQSARWLLEIKHNLPWRAGEALTRLVEQVQGALATGRGQVAVWSLKNPTDAQKRLLERTLGAADYARIRLVSGVQGLWEFLTKEFGGV